MTMKLSHLFVILPLVLSFGLISGCGNKSKLKGLVPASGVVMFENAPVEGASVMFAPTSGAGPQRTATTTTDAKGRFFMMTLNPGDGVFPGEYSVSISKTEPAGEAKPSYAIDGTVVEGREQRDGRYRNLLPEKYSVAKDSGLNVTISPKGDKKIEFLLEGKVDDTIKMPPGPGKIPLGPGNR